MDVFLIGHDYKYEIAEFLKLFSSEFSFKEISEELSYLGIGKNSIIDCSEDYKDEIDSFIEKYIGEDLDKIIILNFLNSSTDNRNVYVKSKSIIYRGLNRVYENTLEEIIKLSSNEVGDTDEMFDKSIESKIKTVSKRLIQKTMFPYLKENFDVNLPWGILTGIRPVKLIHSLMDNDKTDDEIREFMINNYLITDEKLDLILDIAKRERRFIYPLSKDKISLYISVPFCPTRCLYCSFPSHPLKKYKDLRDEYVEKLLIEARGLNEIILKQGKEIESLYIGGGTPTALEAEQLKKLIQGVFEIFNLTKIKEFTVEAGRPDSITKEKLQALKDSGVDRISINPQTFKDKTLSIVGRNHSSNDIITCFNMARELGFDNINMDIILGLPKETPEDVEETLKKIVELDPESVTIHTLALKRASDLKMNMDEYKRELTGYESMIKMLDLSSKYMKNNGYNPYYMYRQKHMLGNLENVGYAKEGYECLYNMQIMEEKQSNYAIGAGAVSKFVYLDENRIERVDDVKNVEIYIQRVEDMIDKKIREVEKNDKSSKRN